MSDACDLLCLDLPLAEELRAKRLPLAGATAAAAQAKALGDPTRLTIAAALRDASELCVCDLSWIVERAENLVSHHVRVLRTAGLVSSRRDGKMVMYALTDPGRALLDVVLAQVPAS
jgi:DNA-binding transcriptional ArsR family regulator